MKLKKASALLVAIGLTSSFNLSAHTHEMNTMTCGHVSNPLIQKDLREIDRLYAEGGLGMTDSGISFETRRRTGNPDDVIVIARFASGQVCFAPTPPELNVFK